MSEITTNTFFRGFTDKSLAVAVACDFLKHNTMPAGEVAAFVTTLHGALKALGPDAPIIVQRPASADVREVGVTGTGVQEAALSGTTKTDQIETTAAGPLPGAGATAGAGAQAPEITPKSSKEIRDSVRPDGIISFIDGKPYQTMKRHLTKHGHTPESYRTAFGLSQDYPMTSPNYAEARRQMAQAQGLGTRADAAPAQAPAPAPRSRRTPQAAPQGRTTRRTAAGRTHAGA